jgi:polyferredoxin
MNVQRLRLFVQLVFFVLLVYGGLFAFDPGGKLPTFSCVFVDSKGGGCFLVSLQHRLAQPIPAYLGQAGIGLLILLGVVSLWAIALNKAWCGWICPFGFLQDLMTKLRNLFSIDLSRLSWITSKRYRSVKYILLALLILIPLAIGNLGFSRSWTAPFCQMCPARPLMPLLEGNFSEFHIDFSSIPGLILTTIAIVLVGLFFTVSFIKRRFFCSYCPMLAFLSLFDKVGLLSLKKDGQRCTRCGNCYRACPMEIRAIEEEKVKKNLVTQDCILCLRCVESCPESKALEVTFAGLPIFKASEEGFLKRQEKTTRGSEG